MQSLPQSQYNYLWVDRRNCYDPNRCLVNPCPLVCHLSQFRDNSDYYSQSATSPELKKTDPFKL